MQIFTYLPLVLLLGVIPWFPCDNKPNLTSDISKKSQRHGPRLPNYKVRGLESNFGITPLSRPAWLLINFSVTRYQLPKVSQDFVKRGTISALQSQAVVMFSWQQNWTSPPFSSRADDITHTFVRKKSGILKIALSGNCDKSNYWGNCDKSIHVCTWGTQKCVFNSKK